MKQDHHHILLVDDDLSEQFFSQRALTNALSNRSTVHVVNSGNEAIRYMIGEGEFSDRDRYPFPTLVITDLNMPDGDGFDVLEFMQGNPEWSVVPRILFSASENEDDVRTAYLLGASAYHTKVAGGDLEKSMLLMMTYWTSCQVPPVDKQGRLLITKNFGGPAARYDQPKGGDQMKRPGEAREASSHEEHARGHQERM